MSAARNRWQLSVQHRQLRAESRSASPFPSTGGEIPWTYSHFTEPYIALARASGVTKTIKLGTGITLVPGMVFTIEPMINLGKRDLHILPDNWTAVTDDKSLSAQFEQTILVTEDGFESFTPYDLG